jgi:hypothetical protein
LLHRYEKTVCVGVGTVPGKSDGAIGIKINGKSVVTITKSGKKARIIGKNLGAIPRGTHRGANRYQFDI